MHLKIFLRRKVVLRLLLLATVTGALLAFFALDLGRYTTLQTAKQSLELLVGYAEAHKPLLIGCFFVAYIILAALSLPGAAVMSMAGAALFGFWTGLLVVSFASSLGALLAFLLSRYLLRGWVQQRYGKRLARINDGVAREGAFYLFSLRLVPVFPFFLINLTMALTPMKPWTFYWVSQLGMLPATAVFVYAGKELGAVHSVGDVLSADLLLAFALLGILPLLLRKGLALYRARMGRRPLPGEAP